MEHVLGNLEPGAACPCGSGKPLESCCGRVFYQRGPSIVVEEEYPELGVWQDPYAGRTDGPARGRPRLLEESQARLIALANHRDLAEVLQRGELPQITMGPACGPFSWLMHLQLHVIVEIQLESGNPTGIWEIEKRLRATGLGPHAIRHAVMQVLFERIEGMPEDATQFEVGLYMQELERMVRSRELPA